MSTYTATISDFLKSHYKHPLTDNPAGLTVGDNGFYLDPRQIIEQTHSKLFENMRVAYIDTEFQKAFCIRFYDWEIGRETFGSFRLALEHVLAVECQELLKARQSMLLQEFDDLILSYKNWSLTNGKGDNQALAIQNMTPQERLEILFTDKYGVIEYANALAENHGKYENENRGETKGWQGQSLAEKILSVGALPNLTDLILKKCEHLFMGVF